MSRLTALTLVLGGLLSLPAPGGAQSPWLGSDRAARVAIELYRPGFDAQDELKAASSALFLSGRFRPVPEIAFVGELPIAFGGDKQDSEAGTQIGNPYLGIELGPADGKVWLEAGGRLPLVGSDANSGVLVGAFSDIDRLSAFASETGALSAALNLGLRDPSGFGFRVRAGPELLIATHSSHELDGMTDSDTETLLYYGAQISRVRGALDIAAHVSGAWNTSADGADFGEASSHQLGIAGSYAIGGVRPGLTFRLPLDKDLREAIDYVVGVTLQVPLR